MYDCKAKNTLDIKIDNKKLSADKFLGRYHMVDDVPVLIEKESDIEGKNIKLRTPMLCVSKGIKFCQVCNPFRDKNPFSDK